MRVLHLGKYYPPHPGGIEAFTADLCRAQARRGHEVAALVHQRGPVPETDPADAGVRIRRAPVAAEFLFTPLAPAFGRLLREEIAAAPPDLLHLHLPNPSALAVLARTASRRIPAVLHWHSDIVASPLRRGLRLAYPCYRPAERMLLVHARAILVTSPPYLESSAALAEFRERCRVLPLGIDPARLAPRGEAPAWPPGQPRILAVGRLTYYKGWPVLLEALARMAEGCLVIVGSGEEEARLRATIERLGLGQRVALVTDAGDAERNAWLAAADCLCLPSLERTEAFGIVLLEALAAGLPFVVSDIDGSGAPWLARESGAGLTVPPGDAPALATALERLGADAARRRALGAAGRAALTERFHIDRVAELLDAVYSEVLGAGPS